MKKSVLLVAFLFSQVVLAEDCFNSRFVSGWDYDSNTEVLSVNDFSKVYEVKTMNCHELEWARTIGFKSFSGIDVCRGDQIVVLDSATHQVTQICPIRSITLKPKTVK